MEPPQGRVWGRSAEGGPASEGANSQTDGGPWRGVHPGSLPVAMGVTSSPEGQQSTGASAGLRAPSRGPCARHPSGLVPPVPPSLQPSANMSRAPRGLCSCCHVPQDARLPALRSAPTPERLPRPASPSLPLAPRSCTRPSADVDGGVCCPPAARTRPLQEGGGVPGSPLAAPRCLPVRGAWLAFAEWRGLAYGYNLYGYHLHPILKTRNRMSS